MKRPLTFKDIDTQRVQGCAWHTSQPHNWMENGATDKATLCYYAVGFRLCRNVQ